MDPQVGVITSITVTPCVGAIEWYRDVFGAVETVSRMMSPDGTVAHAEIEIEGTRIMLADEWPDSPNRSPTTLGGVTAVLYLHTTDVDRLWERAVAAGAEVVFPLQDQFYGDRAGRIRDPFGVQWSLGQRIETLSDEEMVARAESWIAENT